MERRLTIRRLDSQPNSRDRGYILIGILFMVTILIIGLAVAVPSLKTSIKREREEELIHRGHQYTRAIQLYYRKYGRYPGSIDQLESTNTLRFLRQKYKDPITGTDEWKLIRFGQARAKARPAYLKGATPASSLGGPQGGQGGLGPTGTVSTSGAQGGPGLGSTGTVSTSGTQGGPGFGSTGTASTSGTQGGPGGLGSTGTGTGSTSLGAGISNASDISKPLSGSQTLGGGPIVGVASTSEKEGVKEIDGKTKYNEWEFVYDPTLDRAGAVGGVPGAGTAGGTTGGVQGGTNGMNPGGLTSPGIGDQRPTRSPR